MINVKQNNKKDKNRKDGASQYKGLPRKEWEARGLEEAGAEGKEECEWQTEMEGRRRRAQRRCRAPCNSPLKVLGQHRGNGEREETGAGQY